MSHTKGPWTLGNENNAHAEVEVGESTVSLSRYPRHGDGFCMERDEMLANAHLISAAPELLEALEAVVRLAGRDTDVFNDARDAIRKAKGQP
jgi:hypothetical protein